MASFLLNLFFLGGRNVEYLSVSQPFEIFLSRILCLDLYPIMIGLLNLMMSSFLSSHIFLSISHLCDVGMDHIHFPFLSDKKVWGFTITYLKVTINVCHSSKLYNTDTIIGICKNGMQLISEIILATISTEFQTRIPLQ